jgi:hypothetical protein
LHRSNQLRTNMYVSCLMLAGVVAMVYAGVKQYQKIGK